MEKKNQIAYQILFYFLVVNFVFSQDKWNYSANEMEQTKINGKKVRRLKDNVHFYKDNKVITTDNAIQYISSDILYMNGNTIMIEGLDTLTCDSMVFFSKLDSGYAMGSVNYKETVNKRNLTTEILHYWNTDGYRGLSFYTNGTTNITEKNNLISAEFVSYNDEIQLMTLKDSASVINNNSGISGEKIIIQYADSIMKKIEIIDRAQAYYDIYAKVNKKGADRIFQNKMSSKKMVVDLINNELNQLNLFNMATTNYNVIDDSLLVGNNIASGDSIFINFSNKEISRLQVQGGTIGEFHPEHNNSKIDTIIFYGGEYLDYQIQEEKTIISKNAYVEYQDTELQSGKIIVDWKTNILDAVYYNDEHPSVKTIGEAPMYGNAMVFDLTTKRGKILKGKTSYNEAIYLGKEVYRDAPNTFHVKKSKYTSCDLERPHFYLGSNKMKMLPGDKIIVKPLILNIYDIPIIGLPLAVLPSKSGNRHSGWIMPSFDSYGSKGNGFRNLGYFWAPNDYMDIKTVIDFFDKEGIKLNQKLRYKKQAGDKVYNYNIVGDLSGNFKRLIETDEIMDIRDKSLSDISNTIRWNHRQKLDPTQTVAIKYEYVSRSDIFKDPTEVVLENRLKQNLTSNINYNKNWQMSSFTLRWKNFRDLAVENKSPISIDLYKERYKTYKYNDGPHFTFNLRNRKVFGRGDRWFNSIAMGYYKIQGNKGRNDYMLIANDSLWAERDTIKKTFGGIKHSGNINSKQTFFNWLQINPSIDFKEDWIFQYKEKFKDSDTTYTLEKTGFKRRFTWNASINTGTKIYGLLPVSFGKISAIRHILKPNLSFTYRPDFSKSKFGGDNFFQKVDSVEIFDYFSGSYVGATSKQERQSYHLSLSNEFWAKTYEEDNFKTFQFLTISSGITYDAFKDTIYNLNSTMNIKNTKGDRISRINLTHNFYKLDNKGDPTNNIINILNGELPRLTAVKIYSDYYFELFGNKYQSHSKVKNEDSLGISNNDYDMERLDQSLEDESIKNNVDNYKIWTSSFGLTFDANWRESNKEWDHSLYLNTGHSIWLSNKWLLKYNININLKEKEIGKHEIKITRPLHCWEFSFNYWPGNSYSGGFSLKINVKNPDLRDIKITSKSSNY